jgi:hypothetical protein
VTRFTTASATASLVAVALAGCGSEQGSTAPTAIIPGGRPPVTKPDAAEGCDSLASDDVVRTVGEAIDGWVIGREAASGGLVSVAERLDDLAAEEDTESGVARALRHGSKALRRAADTGPGRRAVPSLSNALDRMGRRLQKRCGFSLG